MSTVSFTWRGLTGTLVAFVVAAGCVRLGFWQLDRLDQRRDRNTAVEERLALAPAARAVAPADTTGWLFRRIELTGEYDHGRTLVLCGRSFRGVPGVHVLSPLRLADGGAVLVNRGWLPAADGRTVDLREYEERGRVTVLVLALPYPLHTVHPDERGAADAPGLVADSVPRAWARLDGGALQRLLPYPVAPFYVQLLPDGEADRLPARLPLPELGEGPHLSYAVQWFGFATVALLGWGALAMRGRRQGAPPMPRSADTLP